MKFIKLIAVTAAISAVSLTSAFGDAAETIAARQAAMKTMGGAMKTIGGMAQGKIAFDSDAAAAAATLVAETAATLPTLFEAEEMSADSKAAPAIWENWDNFVAGAGALEAGATALAAAAGSAETYAAAFGPVGGSCGGCHKAFQKK